MRTIPIALLTGLILLPLAAGANPIGPSWIYSLVRELHSEAKIEKVGDKRGTRWFPRKTDGQASGRRTDVP